MARLEKANQIIKLLVLLQNSYRGVTVDEIAQEFDCTRRSAERMKALIAENFPDKIEEVENTTDRKKRWRLKKGSVNYLINFTASDIANLELCKNTLKNSTQQDEIQELINKIKAINTNKIHDLDVETVLEVQGYAVRQGFRENISLKTLDIIKEAILCQKQIKITHNNATYNVHPYGFLIAEKQYLVVYNPLYKEFWTYRLSLISNIEIVDEYFDNDENFNLKKYAEKSFGVYQDKPLEVKLQFNKNTKEVLEYNFHPTQEIRTLENGNFEVTFTAGGDFEIITELLKWRDSVKIISPIELKEKYKKEVTKMFENLD